MFATPVVASDSAGVPGLDCAIHPARTVELAAPIDGVLAEVLVEPGDVVQAGDLIARIDTDIAAADLESARLRAESDGGQAIAEARLASARKRYQRSIGARDEGVITEVEFEEAEAALRIARQELLREKEVRALARSEARRTEVVVSKGEIRAPAAGVIGEQLLSTGESVSGKPVATLIVMESKRVEVYAPMRTLEQFRRTPDDFVLLAGSDPTVALTPEFDYISPLADRSSDTVRVYYRTAHTDVFPGMRCFLVTQAQAQARGVRVESSESSEPKSSAGVDAVAQAVNVE